MIISLLPGRLTPGELETFAEQQLKPELLSVEGVAFVDVTGAGMEEYVVVQDYENITRMKGSFESIFERVVQGNHSIPLGALVNEYDRIPITFPGKYRNLFDVSGYPLFIDENLLYGYDLFSVEKRQRESEKVSLVNNQNACTLHLFRSDFSNILEIDRGVRKVLQKWDETLSSEFLYNQADGFKSLLRQLEVGIVTAVFCVFVVLLLFYRRYPLAALIVITIPLCFSGTLAFLRLSGKSLNIMTLSGLIVGIAICIDNTIIMIESVQRHVEGGTLRNALLVAMERSSRPILSSTLTTIVFFLPLFYLDKRMVVLYVDFALTLSMMLLFSALVSFLFVPCFMNLFYVKRAPEGTGN